MVHVDHGNRDGFAAGRRVAPADGDADTDIVKIDKDFSVRQGVMNSQDSEDRDDGIGLVTGDDYGGSAS